MTTPRRPVLKRLERYKDVKDFPVQGFSKDEWTDDMVLFEDALPLTILSKEETTQAIKRVIRGISVAMTEKVAYDVLLLAWNLKSESDPDTRVFPASSARPVTGNPLTLSDLESASAGNGSQIVDPVGVVRNTLEFNRAGCYYAASMLRLFTKDASSWVKAQEHIKENYKRFTDQRFDLGEFDVWGPSVDALRGLYQTNLIYRKTLGQILYFANGIEEGKQMTRLLFEQHLAFTGMHIVELFCRGCTGLNAARPDLLNALYHGGNQTTLEQLEKILKEYMGSEDEAKKRETYKFARLYDPMMFSLLQTKNCAESVCILANIDKLCGNVGSGDVMGIAAISVMGDLPKKRCRQVAQKIFDYYSKPGMKNNIRVPCHFK